MMDADMADTPARVSPGGGRAERRPSGGLMTEEEQRERRASIREIMQDEKLTPAERRRSIQQLMDGRRRSSASAAASSLGGGSAHQNMSMMAAAAAAAADFYDSSDDDSLMDDSVNGNDDNNSNNNDHISNHGVSIGSEDDDDDPDLPDSLPSLTGSSITTGNNVSGRMSRRRGSGNLGGSSSSDTGYQRAGRSASLRAFAGSAAAAAAAAAAAFCDDPDDVLANAKRMEKSRPKCTHYERQCTIISPCCGLAFGCRICHDECPVLPPPILLGRKDDDDNDDHMHMSSNTDWHDNFGTDPGGQRHRKMEKRQSLPADFNEEETHHDIDRFAIKEIICRSCFTRQSSKTNCCINCGITFGSYHCNVCNLWMSDEEDPYHCDDCGFCRVGGRDNFKHCHDCGMCIDALLFDDHNCKAGKYMSNCPVCQEDLFSSRSASHEMPCGHAIHWHCFRELTSFDTRCPVCKKTAETHEQMAPTWSAMAMGIALQPVPPEMARVVTIVCNDCEVQDEDRRWHFLGVQCNECGSFNTTVERTILMGREAAVFLGDDVTGTGGDGGSGNSMNGNRNDTSVGSNSNAGSPLGDVMAAMEESASNLELDDRRNAHDSMDEDFPS